MNPPWPLPWPWPWPWHDSLGHCLPLPPSGMWARANRWTTPNPPSPTVVLVCGAIVCGTHCSTKRVGVLLCLPVCARFCNNSVSFCFKILDCEVHVLSFYIHSHVSSLYFSTYKTVQLCLSLYFASLYLSPSTHRQCLPYRLGSKTPSTQNPKLPWENVLSCYNTVRLMLGNKKIHWKVT